MKIIIAGNYNYKDWIDKNIFQLTKFGYEYIVYDLGGLGYGIPNIVEDKSFQENRCYGTGAKHFWKAKGLHKPRVIKHALENNKEFLLYLDADAVIQKPLIDIEGDYDIGVALRSASEISLKSTMLFHHLAQHNAGVIFFNPTEATKNFVDIWIKLTDLMKSDQMALNYIIEFLNIVKVKRFSDFYNSKIMDRRVFIHHVTNSAENEIQPAATWEKGINRFAWTEYDIKRGIVPPI